MKILFWTPYPTIGASTRYRVEQYLPYLNKMRIKYTVHPFWCNSAYKILYKKGFILRKIYYFILGSILRLRDLMLIKKYDIVFILRESYPLGGTFFENLLGMLKKPFIFDFDDAIFLSYCSQANNFIEKFKKPHKVSKIIKMSNYVIAGNRYLADFALQYNRSVSVIPTAVDTDKYQPIDNRHNNEIVIGWIGSTTTSDFLNIIRNTFIQLSKRFNNLKFKIVGSNFLIDGLRNFINIPWSLEEEIEQLRMFDIGIMPMLDNDWTRGKCGFKVILYMAMGIPCVCSPVGVNKEIVTDGVNGFLADTEDEWMEKLSLLIKNSELRKKIGLVGRKTIEEKYSVKLNAPKFLEIIQRIYSESKKIKP